MGKRFAPGAQCARGKSRLPSCRRYDAASRPSLLALLPRSVTSAHSRGSFITAGKPEFWRLPQTTLVSWTAPRATSSLIPPLPKPSRPHPRPATICPIPASAALNNRCAALRCTLPSFHRHPPALTVSPPKTLATSSPVPFFGYNASQSVGERVVEGVTGQFTNQTMWFLIGGIATMVGGAALTFWGGRRATE